MISDLRTKSNNEKQEYRLKNTVNAATAIYLVIEYSVDISADDRAELCKALLPESYFESDTCPDVEALKEAFPTLFQ